MPKLLVVQTSPRGDKSISRNITERFLERWQAAYPGGEITTRDLAETELDFATAPWVQAAITPIQQHTSEMSETMRLSDMLVDELLAADHLAVSTPVYNFNIPASLKAWSDHVIRKGKTVGFDGKGLLIDKKATLLIASGGVYTEGSPIRDRDIATQYLRLLMTVLGIGGVSVVAGGGAKAVDMGEVSMADFVAKMDPAIAEAVAAS